eukprot:scaffold1982_cov93-Amphora_coffeaeformis.AAC.48
MGFEFSYNTKCTFSFEIGEFRSSLAFDSVLSCLCPSIQIGELRKGGSQFSIPRKSKPTTTSQTKYTSLININMPCAQVHRFHHGPRHHPFFMMAVDGPNRCGGLAAFRMTHHLPNHQQQALLAHKARVSETDEAFTVRMDIPGVQAPLVTIEEKGGELEIVAIRMTTNGEVDKTYQDVFYLDPTKAELAEIKANLIDGVLTITAPKKAKPEPIAIQAVSVQPPMETGEESTGFRVTLDMPGIKPSKLSIKVHDNVLSLRGERPMCDEIMVLRRMVEIPRHVDMTQASAYLMDGVFTLVAPPRETITDTDAATPLRIIPVNDIPNMDDLDIGDDITDEEMVQDAGDSHEDGEKEMDTGSKKNDVQSNHIMVETVEEKDWEHVDDSKPSAQN